jgi:hypothetical protein
MQNVDLWKYEGRMQSVVRRNLVQCLLASTLTVCGLPALACGAAGHVRPAHIVRDEVRDLFVAKDYGSLDRLARRYEREGKATFDGRSALEAFYQGIEDGYTGCANAHKADGDWEAHERALQAWIDASKDPVPARLALAHFTLNYAWKARGNGPASTVDDRAMALFRERLALARSRFEALAKSCENNAAWYDGMLTIAKAQHMDMAAFEQLYRKAVRADPYFEDVHFQHADYFRPAWYGSPKLFRSAVEQAVKATSPRLGTAMYAKLHWDLSESDTMFTDGSVDWKRMKGGFEDALRTYPSAWTRSNYARLACEAKDSATLRVQMDKLGDQVRKDAWGDPVFFTYCQAMAKLDGTGRQPQCFKREDNGQVFCE